MNSRGASEVLGALLVISLIVSIAGILYMMSYPIINDSEETVKYRKAYFDLLEVREKIENVRSGLEFNSTYVLRLSDVSFSFQNEPTIIINGINYTVSSVKVSGKGWSLYYENGVIIEKRPTYSKILHFPDIYYDAESDTLVMPIIMFTGNKSVGGSGFLSLNMRLESVSKSFLENADVTIESSNYENWYDFFTKIGFHKVSKNSGKVTLENVSKLDVTIYEVSIV